MNNIFLQVGHEPLFDTGINSGAAFERISRVQMRTLRSDTLIDIRNVTLAMGHPDVETQYDPKKHRSPKSPIKIWMAYLNLLRSMFGAGVLAMPLAISQTGMILGPMLTIIFIMILNHTHHILLWSINEVSKRLEIPYISYRYGFRIALLHGPIILRPVSHIAPIMIAAFMFLSQLGICCVFLVFVADSLRDLFDCEDTRNVMAIIFIPTVAMVFFMKNLKVIGYISMMGNVSMLFGMVLTLYFIFSGEPYNEYILGTDNVVQIMFAVGIILFNHSAIGVILSIDKALPDPYLLTKPLGMLDLGMVIPALFGMVFGSLGYWKFGMMEENVLRSLPFDDRLAHLVFALYSSAVAFTYPVQCFPGIEIMLEVFQATALDFDCNMKVIDYILRAVFVTLSFLVIWFVPYQGPFVAFVGSLCTAQLTLVFPAMMELSLLYPGRFGTWNVLLIKDIFLITLGLFVSSCGAVMSGYIIYLRKLMSA